MKKFKIFFFKMHGLGNDYIYVNLFLQEEEVKGYILKNKIEVAKFLSKNHYGIGSDGLIYISLKEDIYQVEIYNKDGSYSEVCGNGFRCIGFYLYMKKWVGEHFFIRSGSRKYEIEIKKRENVSKNTNEWEDLIIWVNMGNFKELIDQGNIEKGNIEIEYQILDYVYIDIGNPHCVIFYNEHSLDEIDLRQFSLKIESFFKKKGLREGINIEFVKVLSTMKVMQRTWERGSGETLACASGATAVFIIGLVSKMFANDVTVYLQGGTLSLSLKDGFIWQSGKVNYLFDGNYYL